MRKARIRNQARRADARARSLAHVLHELRPPLALTIAPLEELRDDEGLGKQARGRFDMALSNAWRMMELVSQALDDGYHEESPKPLHPLRAEPADLDSAPVAHLSQRPKSAGEHDEDRTTVLVADGHPQRRELLGAHLAASYRIHLADDGVEALRIARRESADLVVSDVRLPRLDGFGLLGELRRDPDLSFVPVLLLSDRTTTQETVAGLLHGADDYLSQPFDLAELAARVAGLLASRERLRRHLLRQLNRPKAAQSFEDRVRVTILENLGDSDFSVRDLAGALAVDRTVLFRRVKQLFGKPPNELIRDMRLDRAAELLRSGETNVTEVCYTVGFESLAYFSRRFRERFSVPPSRYRGS